MDNTKLVEGICDRVLREYFNQRERERERERERNRELEKTAW
jgi:hypothetical protein